MILPKRVKEGCTEEVTTSWVLKEVGTCDPSTRKGDSRKRNCVHNGVNLLGIMADLKVRESLRVEG